MMTSIGFTSRSEAVAADAGKAGIGGGWIGPSKPDIVLEQQPRAGTRIAAGRRLSLIVSANPSDSSSLRLYARPPTPSSADCPTTMYVDVWPTP